jgi:POT family proton-dependent oligopeptide transporter
LIWYNEYAGKSGVFHNKESGNALIADLKDHWGRPLEYLILNSTSVRIWSAGGDGKQNTKWDVGIIIGKSDPVPEKKASWMDKIRPEETWLSLRKAELGIKSGDHGGAGEVFSKTTFSGGQVRLQGASYFWFFSALMGATALLFIPFAIIYRPKSYLQE